MKNVNAGIKKITLINVVMKGFRRFKDRTEFSFNDSKTIFCAANKKGKTTISEAILWAFLGVNLEGNDKADKFLMNRDSSEMMVQVEFLDEGGNKQILERMRQGDNTTISINGNKYSQKQVLYGVGFRKEFLLMSLNLDYFFKLSEKDKRDFFVSLLPSIDNQDIFNSLSEFEANMIADDVEKINADPNGYLKERRTELKGNETEITRLKGKLEVLVPSKEGIPTKQPLDTSKLEDLEKQYESLLLMKADTNSIETKLNNLHKQKNSIEQELAVVEHSVVMSELKDNKELIQKRLILKNEINSLETREYKKSKDEEISKLSAEIKYLREQYKKERAIPIEEGMTCPTCRHTVEKKDISNFKEVIGVTLKHITKQAEVITVKLNQLQNKEKENENTFISESKKIIEIKRKELESIDAEISKVEQHNTAIIKDFANIKVVKLENLNKKKEAVVKEITALEKIKKDTEIAFEQEVGTKRENLKKLLATERSLNQEIEKNNAERAFKIKNYNETLEKYKATATEIKATEQKISELNLKISATKNYNQKNAELLADLIKEHFNKLSVSLQKLTRTTGEIKDCFELYYEGESLYSLSNARSQRMRIALEIYDFIVNSTGLQYPLYLDNAESIDEYTTIAHQIVETRVVPGQSLTSNILTESQQLQIA